MNEQVFERPGMRDRLQQMVYLLKNTITIIGRDTGILRPLYRVLVYAVIMTTAFFAGIALCVAGSWGSGMLLILIALLLSLYKYFYYTRQRMVQSWLVAQTVRGHETVPGDGRKRVKQMKSQARGLGWASLGFAWVKSQADDSGGGIKGFVIRLVLVGLTEIWDLARHFLAPAVTVDEYSLREGAEQLKTLRNAVPETLVGVFGVDIAGGVVRTILGPISLGLMLLGIVLGFWVGDAVPAFSLGDLRDLLGANTPAFLGDGPIPVSFLPLLIAVWLGCLGSAVLGRLVDCMKNIYFSIFYMRLAHIDEITPDLQAQLDSYLAMTEDAADSDRPDPDTAGEPT